jgi:hypothetical protein
LFISAMHSIDYRWKYGHFPCPRIAWQLQPPIPFSAVKNEFIPKPEADFFYPNESCARDPMAAFNIIRRSEKLRL